MRVVGKVLELGLNVLGVMKASPRGSKGNEEFFLLCSRLGGNIDIERAVERALDEQTL